MDSKKPSSILWRRLDTEGHDTCRLVPLDTGWRLEGIAAFGQDGRPCGLAYSVECDRAFRTHAARVTGSIGDEGIDLRIARTEDRGWLVDGIVHAKAGGLEDIDLGFTPATNLIAIRRLDLAVGEGCSAPAAYLAFPELRIERLDQTYARLDERRYRYTAPAYAYDDVITVSSIGFVTSYPRLWEAVGGSQRPLAPTAE
jgi:hypothetical protein